MLLKDLVRLRRDKDGRVPLDVLHRLALPMPDDVLEQFLLDHGLKGATLAQFGLLDLHEIHWTLEPIPASRILQASVFDGYRGYVLKVAARANEFGVANPKELCISSDAARSWREVGSWCRPPVAIDAGLLGADAGLHWVEGHTRLGMLRGLVERGELRLDGTHSVWVGAPGAAATPSAFDLHAVLVAERIPFVQWLLDQADRDDDIGRLGGRALMRCDDDDFLDALEAGSMGLPSEDREALMLARSEWERVTTAPPAGS